MKEKLTSPAAVLTITVALIVLFTLLTCHVRDKDVFSFLSKNRNYKNIQIHHCNYFYATVEVDSGSLHVEGGVVNAYAKLYLVNLKVK